MGKDCVWTEDPDDGFWSTGCGKDFEFLCGGPGDNRFSFCPYCGEKIFEEPFVEEEERE